MTDRLQAWILERRQKVLAPIDMDQDAIAEIVEKGLLGADVVIVGEELVLRRAEISFEPADEGVTSPRKVLAPTSHPDREVEKPKELVVPSHGDSGYHRGCRCEICKAAKRAQNARRRGKPSKPQPTPSPAPAPAPAVAHAPKVAPTPKKPAPTAPSTSRAKVTVNELTLAECPGCGERLGHQKIVLANVYVDGTWDRVERWHIDCYEAAGSPHGEVATKSAQAANEKPRICENCGKEFFRTSTRRAATTCSSDCSDQRKAAKSKEPKKADPPPVQVCGMTGGPASVGRYNKGCRCEGCRAASTAYQAEYRKRKAAAADA